MDEHDGSQEIHDDLLRLLVPVIRDGLRIRLGPNAIALAQAGEPLRLSGGEADAAAELAMTVVWPRIMQLWVLMERMADQHVRYAIVGEDPPVFRCMKWCWACKYERAQDDALAQETKALVFKGALRLADNEVKRLRGILDVLAKLEVTDAGPGDGS